MNSCSVLWRLITGISPVSFSAPGSVLGVHAGGVCDGVGREWADMVLSHGPEDLTGTAQEVTKADGTLQTLVRLYTLTR